MSLRPVAGYRPPQSRLVRRSTGAAVATAAAGTAISGFFLIVFAWVAVKFVMLPTFIVNLVYLWDAYHTTGGMDRFDPTWLIISGVVVVFG